MASSARPASPRPKPYRSSSPRQSFLTAATTRTRWIARALRSEGAKPERREKEADGSHEIPTPPSRRNRAPNITMDNAIRLFASIRSCKGGSIIAEVAGPPVELAPVRRPVPSLPRRAAPPRRRMGVSGVEGVRAWPSCSRPAAEPSCVPRLLPVPSRSRWLPAWRRRSSQGSPRQPSRRAFQTPRPWRLRPTAACSSACRGGSCGSSRTTSCCRRPSLPSR